MSDAPYIDPQPSVRHACINAACGCDDLVSAGPCTEWCSANGVERVDLESDKAADPGCSCGHELCVERRAHRPHGEPASPIIR